jgi:cell division ATPase FtsA
MNNTEITIGAAPTPKPIVLGLDVGAYKTRCVALYADTESPMLAGYSEVSSSGWKKGEIIDHEAVTKCLNATIEASVGASHAKIEVATIGVGHRKASMALRKPETTSVEEGSEISDRFKISDPDEMKDGLCVEIPNSDFAPYLSVATSCIRADYINFLFEPLAALLAVNFEADDGNAEVLLIDIGDQSSGCALYKRCKIHAAFGMTASISSAIRNVAFQEQIAFEDARELLRHAVRDADRSSEQQRNTGKIIERQSEYIASSILREMMRHGMDLKSLPREIVLTGEGASMHGLESAFHDAFDCHINLGFTKRIGLLPVMSSPEGWCTAYGLAVEAFISHRHHVQSQKLRSFLESKERLQNQIPAIIRHTG